MPHPFHPDDFDVDDQRAFKPNKFFLLKGAVHFKATAKVLDVSDRVSRPFNNFSNAFVAEAAERAREVEDKPRFEIKSCGDMMRTIKTMTSSSGERLCDLNITFVSFGSSYVRFPAGSKHSRHEIELCPVDDRMGFHAATKHEAFVKNSIPYFWDLTSGPVGVLYKCLNQKRVEVAKVTSFGFDRDAILALDGEELNDVCAVATCIILLNGRDAMDH